MLADDLMILDIDLYNSSAQSIYALYALVIYRVFDTKFFSVMSNLIEKKDYALARSYLKKYIAVRI